jgi:alkylation response protein AidB-like acyl-CoA dehydrogenase
MFTEAIQAILEDQFTPAAIRAIEAGGSAATPWAALADAGFLELLATEADGGAGLGLADLFPILLSIGHHAVPVPLAQSIAARALLGRAGVPAPAGMITLAQYSQREADGALTCAYTPFGTMADFVVAGSDAGAVLLDCAGAERAGTGVHGSQAATLRWPAGYAGQPLPGVSAAQVQEWGAALHAALIAGAAARVGTMTLQYCQDRSQFGKTIGKYQAIQHQLAVMTEWIAAATVAAELAFTGDASQPARLPVAIAKARASEAAQSIAATAHGLHGAIGITEEYDLQLLTRRLHEWRAMHGSEGYWNGVVGEAVLAGGGEIVGFVRELV